MGKCKQANEFQSRHYGHPPLIIHEQNRPDSRFKVVLYLKTGKNLHHDSRTTAEAITIQTQKNSINYWVICTDHLPFSKKELELIGNFQVTPHHYNIIHSRYARPPPGRSTTVLVNPLTTNDAYWRHQFLVACYQLAQSVLKIGPVLETVYVILLNIHKRLPKPRCSSHFARPEEKKKVLYTFPGPNPNPNPIPNHNL